MADCECIHYASSNKLLIYIIYSFTCLLLFRFVIFLCIFNFFLNILLFSLYFFLFANVHPLNAPLTTVINSFPGSCVYMCSTIMIKVPRLTLFNAGCTEFKASKGNGHFLGCRLNLGSTVVVLTILLWY